MTTATAHGIQELERRIIACATCATAKDGQRLTIDGVVLESLARDAGVSPLVGQQAACRAGVIPLCYARNTLLLAPFEQGLLLGANVLVVGLGGLGGHVIDMLARMGVGTLTGADGDVFEESNLNRQLLSSVERLGMSKAHAAAAHVAAVNPAVQFTPLSLYLRGDALQRAVLGRDVLVDALGGLDDRLALQQAASAAGVTLVSAGVAGLTGWVSVVRPGETGPAALLGDGSGVEETLGNPAPTVVMAAALLCAEVLKLLTGRTVEKGALLFDLADHTFMRVNV